MFWRFNFLVALTIVCAIVEGKRISQIKCEEYNNQTRNTVRVIPLLPNPTPIEFHSFNCSKTVDLIVGGVEAKKGEFRHQALLGWETDVPGVYSFDCGGTLISERFVLTAAHCTSKGVGPLAVPKIVRFAELDLTEVGDEFDIKIGGIIRHPQYSRAARFYNDIALIRLQKQVPFSSVVRPACLSDDVEMRITSVIATGFGKTNFDDMQNSVTLRKVQLVVLDNSVCNDQFNGTRNFRGMTDKQLCIGSDKGGRDTCRGDSGGPVQLLLNPKGCIYHVLGITSVGTACGLGTAPALYTKVASYVDWIEGIVWG